MSVSRVLFVLVLLVLLERPATAQVGIWDWQVNSVTVSPTTAGNSGTVSVSVKIRNGGGFPTGTMRLVITMANQSLLSIPEDSLGGFEERTLAPLTVTLPADLFAGSNRLNACLYGTLIDHDYDSSNNCGFAPVLINSSKTIDLKI